MPPATAVPGKGLSKALLPGAYSQEKTHRKKAMTAAGKGNFISKIGK